MSEPILTQKPVSIDLSQDAMMYLRCVISASPLPTISYQAEIEIDNFVNLLDNLLERGVGKATISNNEDLL
jgi:hypothetical protein